MLVISDSGKGGGRVLFAAVFFSVCASVVTTLWIHNTIEHGEEADHAAARPPRVVNPDAETERDATIAELKETVARLEAAAGKESADPLETLLNIRSSVMQIAIRDQVAALTGKGDEIVPDIVAILDVGLDQKYQGQLEFDGDGVKRYPRLRTALFDILRQIGTPAAKRALLDALGEDASAADYADLLTILGTTDDAMVIEGINALIPAIRGRIREGDDSRALEDALMRWVENHPGALAPDDLVEFFLEGSGATGINRDLFRLLLEQDVELAYGVVAKLAETDPDLKHFSQGLGTLGTRVPLGPIADLCERILRRLELSDSGRARLYSCLPRHPSTVPETLEARSEDAQLLITVLERQLIVEPDGSAKRALESVINALKTTSD